MFWLSLPSFQLILILIILSFSPPLPPSPSLPPSTLHPLSLLPSLPFLIHVIYTKYIPILIYTHVQVAVAVKTLYGRQEVQGQFIKEANSMCSLNHRHIIQLYGIVLSHPLMLVSTNRGTSGWVLFVIVCGCETLCYIECHCYTCDSNMYMYMVWARFAFSSETDVLTVLCELTNSLFYVMAS